MLHLPWNNIITRDGLRITDSCTSIYSRFKKLYKQVTQTGHTKQVTQTGHTKQVIQTGHTNRSHKTGHTKQVKQTGHTNRSHKQVTQTGHTKQVTQTGHTNRSHKTGHTNRSHKQVTQNRSYKIRIIEIRVIMLVSRIKITLDLSVLVITWLSEKFGINLPR